VQLRGECLDLFIEAGFVPRGFILVHDALGHHLVDKRYSLGQGRTGCFRVAGCDRRIYSLDVGAHHGTLAGVVAASFFCLSRAFSRLCTVSQGFLQLGPSFLRAAICRSGS